MMFEPLVFLEAGSTVSGMRLPSLPARGTLAIMAIIARSRVVGGRAMPSRDKGMPPRFGALALLPATARWR